MCCDWEVLLLLIKHFNFAVEPSLNFDYTFKRETFWVNARTSFSSSAFLSCLFVSRTAVSCLSKYHAVDWRLPTLVSVNCNHIRLYLELSVLRCWPSPKRPGSGPLVPKKPSRKSDDIKKSSRFYPRQSNLCWYLLRQPELHDP